MIHGLVKGDPTTILGPVLECADEQNPRNAGRCVSGVRLTRHCGDGLYAQHDGREWLLVLCDGCLESLVGQLLPAAGVLL